MRVKSQSSGALKSSPLTLTAINAVTAPGTLDVNELQSGGDVIAGSNLKASFGYLFDLYEGGIGIFNAPHFSITGFGGLPPVKAGQIFFNPDTGTFYACDGVAWFVLSMTPA